MNLAACLDELGSALMAVVAAAHGVAEFASDVLPALAFYRAVTVATHSLEPVVVHDQMAVVFYDFGAIVLSEQVQIFLGVDEDMFIVSFVLES